jgi:DNA-binding XRE family transcriptional regulator
MANVVSAGWLEIVQGFRQIPSLRAQHYPDGWLLEDGTENAETQFRMLAGAAAALAGLAPTWQAWLDALKDEKLDDRRPVELIRYTKGRRKKPFLSRSIPDAPAISAQKARAFIESEQAPAHEANGRSYPNAFARNINSLRLKCGWSMEKLAEEAGIQKTTVNAHINKGSLPHPKTLKAYADCFSDALAEKISVADLKA